MDPLSITGTLIAVLQVTTAVISICYDYRQGVASSSRDVLLMSSELNALKDVLESLLRLVENSQSEVGAEEVKFPTVEKLAQKGGTLETLGGELERLKEKLKPQEGWRKLRAALVWPLKEGEMRKCLGDLERGKSMVMLALSADQATQIGEIRDGVEYITRIFEKNSTDQERQNIHRWLNPPDPYENHVANRKKRQPKTGTWLLRGKLYEKWLQSEKSFLWIYGIPGSGKTVLCSTIIEQLVRYCAQPKTALAFFYFDFNDTGKRNISTLVRSLITQLSSQSEQIPLPLRNLYQSCQNGSKPVDEEASITTLQELILTFHNVYIVFDALDESSECEEILQLIHTIQAWNLARLHLLVTSRQLANIEESLLNLATGQICLQDSKMNEDIYIYLAETLQNDKTFTKWPPDIRSQIINKLLEGEDGMFQWVICQLDMLRRCMSIADIRKALAAGLPKNLDQTYDQILSQIDESHQAEVMKTLQAITVTAKPLTLAEVVEILAVDLEATPPVFELDSRLLDPRNILSMCSSLVATLTLPQWSKVGLQRQPRSGSVLRLAHASVADYLTQSKFTSHSEFHFTKLSARLFMAQVCLGYLMNPEFSGGHDKRQCKPRMDAYPFLKHCASYWPLYLRRKSDDPEDHIDQRTKDILQTFLATSKMPNGGNFAFWVGTLIPSSPLNYIQNTQPLYYAASFGLIEVVRIILDTEKDIDIDARGGRFLSSALHVATYRQHMDVARLLLEKGANANLPNKVGETPYYWAAAHADEDMIELLKRYGSDGSRFGKQGAKFGRMENFAEVSPHGGEPIN